MGLRKFRSRRSGYQVCVTILEAKHLPQNANPVVVVKVGDRKRKTVVRERTDAPVYNEYFVFDFAYDLDVLLSMRISIAVYLRNCLRQLKFHGSIVFEAATVWEQPDHEYYHKWAMLTDPKDLTMGPKGYVKCNIIINARGEKVKVHPETEGEEDIEGNLLLPIGGESLPFRQRARYIFTIYRADDLPNIGSRCPGSEPGNINPYVQISFAGLKESTGEAWRTRAPVFNERIVFREMFPALCHRVRIAVKHRGNACQSLLVATSVLDLGKISNSGEYGFLPTFGPSFLHLYGGSASTTAVECSSCSGKCSPTLPFYRGRVLLSLKTEMESPEPSAGIGTETEPAVPIVEKSLWRTEEYYLVGIVYDVCMIDRRRFASKSISFEISLGNAGNRQFPPSSESARNDDPFEGSGAPDFESRTAPRTTGSLDGKYNYLPLGSRKPCLYVRSSWPNTDWRMNNTNGLRFIEDFLEEKLEKLEALVALEDPDAYMAYNEAIRGLRIHCVEYLHTLDTVRYEDEGGTTRLDRHRVNVCRMEIEGILRRIKTDGDLPGNQYIKIALVHAYQSLARIKELRGDPQHSLPDVFLWMIAGSKRVAYSRIRAEEVIYSEVPRERGTRCGKRVDIFLKNPRDEGESEDYSACKIELFLWLGNAKYLAGCWAAIPPGYEVDHSQDLGSFPKYLEYTQSSAFQLRCHVFQGRFDPGMDASGLLDPMVRVTFRGYTAVTRPIRQTLDPFWDQTLILPAVTLHGTKEYIKSEPPDVVLEVFDQDICGTKEFCGRCTAVPVVKLASETYSPPDFPPRLGWYKFESQRDRSTGSVLAAFELIETGTEEQPVDVPISPESDGKIYRVPIDIRPGMTGYRLEVIFWGVRDMKKINYMPVLRPRIVVECAGVQVRSEVMENLKKFSNFEEPHTMVELEMPELEIYYPSVTIKAYDSRGFGCFKFAGICIVPSVRVFMEQLITETEYQAQIHGSVDSQKSSGRRSAVALPLSADQDPWKDENKGLIAYKKVTRRDPPSRLRDMLRAAKGLLRRLLVKDRRAEVPKTVLDENVDWWGKYFASLEEERQRELGNLPPNYQNPVPTFKVYGAELEIQPEFEGFQDRLRSFELWRGKRTGLPDRDTDNYAGTFKGYISIYQWPQRDRAACKTRSGRSAANGLRDDYPPQEPVRLLVRLYVVKGINLQPNDPLSGRSDPYLCVRMGKRVINDKKNYVANQLNPTFGRLFELEAILPRDYMLHVQVWDYDATTADDLIGETRIDIENRFYSRHRAGCGVSRTYQTSGPCAWRDREKPSQILEQICRKNNLPLPEYRAGSVRIGRKEFQVPDSDGLDEDVREERMALAVLHRWQEFPICGCTLVPEHVERRPLFNTKRPGFEQLLGRLKLEYIFYTAFSVHLTVFHGKLELWVDMFQFGQLPPRPPVDIIPQPPEEYEIRVIVWNTEDVPLVDSQFLTGEKCSDIYVKGWIFYEDHQRTDVHYNSLNGEGNFNWRFVFRVMYLSCERAMLVRKKMSIFARDETEEKLPCRLHLQVWDNDHFSADDFLGALTLDLAKMPRGSANSKACTMKLLEPRSSATVDLFKLTRIKAWWPFVRSTNSGKYVQAGKVQLEMSVVRATEADEQPVGKGRDPPQSLPAPNRPDTSFSWFRNPWKACRFVVCRYYKWRIICCLCCVLLALLVAAGIYAFPGYLVKRLLGA